MSDLALRRQIAEIRGWKNLHLSHEGTPLEHLRGDSPKGDAMRFSNNGTPRWDCDLNAAGDLWTEMVKGGFNGFPMMLNVDFQHSMDYLSFIEWGHGGFESRLEPVEIDHAAIADPKERLCVAICRLWLAWQGSKGAKA